MSEFRKNVDKDYLLGLLGLETRRTFLDEMLPTVGFFGLGLLVGAALGIAYSPKRGRELRESIRNRIRERIGERSEPGAQPM